jgi:hypothetical protein
VDAESILSWAIPARFRLPSALFAFRSAVIVELQAFPDKRCSVFNPWLPVILKTMELGFEAQGVIALRMMRFAAGGARGQSEARRMIVEKVTAGVEAQTVAASALASGQKDTVVAGKVLRVLKRRVRANKRRLSRR